MQRIPEEMLHALWGQLHRLAPYLTTVQGQSVQILQPGQYNRNAGPDFLNAILLIGTTKWVGDVEIHFHSKDWHLHQHHKDPAYNAVILHVVAEFNGEATLQNGETPPTLVIPNLKKLLHRYQLLFSTEQTPRCGEALAHLSEYLRITWFTRLLIARLEEKAQAINQTARDCELGWEEAFYRSLARSLGLKVNAEAMYLLACSIPLKAIYKVRDTPRTVEAILFGQAAMLEDSETTDPYRSSLAQEYSYQQKKFQLQRNPAVTWHYMRMRPASFPPIRIAQLASLLCANQQLLSKALEADTVRKLENAFRCTASPHWDTHYAWEEKPHSPKPKQIGRNMLTTIMINSVIPFRFAYAHTIGEKGKLKNNIELLKKLPPEKNSITHAFSCAGIRCENAAQSQALVHLHKHYCSRGACYLCPAGFAVLTCDFKALHEANESDIDLWQNISS